MTTTPQDELADVHDLVRSMVRATMGSGETKEYWSKLREVLLENLTAQLPAQRSSHDMVGLDLFLERALEVRSRDVDPFSGLLEAPRSVSDLYQNHAGPIRERIHEWEGALHELIYDIVAARWQGITNCVVPWETLAERGVPRHPPVLADPWDDI